MTAPAPYCKWNPPFQPKVDLLCPKNLEDKTLNAQELINIALCHNPETQITWARAKASAYHLQAAKSLLYPQVDAEASYALTYQCFEGNGKSQSGVVILNDPLIDESQDSIDQAPLPSISVGEFVSSDNAFNHLILSDISATYLLFDFGGRCAAIESARQALQRANWMHNRNIQNVIIHVLISYYSYLNAKALLDAQKDDLEDAEMNVEAARELFHAGVKTQLDVLQSESQLINIQLVIEETRGLVQTELGNLANALGLPANTPINVAELPKDLPMDETMQNVDSLMEIAKKYRPDLSATLSEYQKKQADLALAESDGKPFVTANTDFERVDGLGHTLSSGYVYSAAIAIEVPIFRGYYYTNRRRAAKARVKEAYAEIQRKESDILLEVWSSYYAFKTAVKTYKYSEKFLKYTEETYEAAMGGYKEGTGSILDLLSAQKALSRARAQIIQARTQWVTSLAGIAYATGTL